MIGFFDFRGRLRKKLANKEYRDAYVGEHVRLWIAHQIKALRGDPKRDWNQGELARRMGKPQSVVSRLEDPSYGKMTVNTLLEVAAAFDVALEVKFVDYPRFLRSTTNLTNDAMAVASFADSDWESSAQFTATDAPLNAFAAVWEAGPDIAWLEHGSGIAIVEMTAGAIEQPDMPDEVVATTPPPFHPRRVTTWSMN